MLGFLHYFGVLYLVCPNFVGQESDQEEGEGEGDDEGPSSSYSSSEKNSYCGDEWSYSLEQMDGYAFDGEVGKRFNQMIPIPVSLISQVPLMHVREVFS